MHILPKIDNQSNTLTLTLESRLNIPSNKCQKILENFPKRKKKWFLESWKNIICSDVYPIEHTSPLMFCLLSDSGVHLFHRDRDGFCILDFISYDLENWCSDDPYFMYKKGVWNDFKIKKEVSSCFSIESLIVKNDQRNDNKNNLKKISIYNVINRK